MYDNDVGGTTPARQMADAAAEDEDEEDVDG